MNATWIRAILQTEEIDGIKLSVLHWKRLALAEAPLVQRAERKRAKMLHIQMPSNLETANYQSMYELPTTLGDDHLVVNYDAESLVNTPAEVLPSMATAGSSSGQLPTSVQVSLPGCVEGSESSDESARPPHLELATFIPKVTATVRVKTIHSVDGGKAQSVSDPTGGVSPTAYSVPTKTRSVNKDTYGHHEDGSVTSKSSSATRSITKLRRYLSSGQHSLLRGLWWLRTVGILLLLLAIGLTIAVTSITHTNFETMSQNLRYIVAGADRMLYKANAIFNLQVCGTF
jgi:hypothetical protein